MNIGVKICGLSTRSDVDAAVHGGAQFVGFMFFPPSPRNVHPELASVLGLHVPRSVKKVAVVVNPSDEEIAVILESINADMLQLHGNESPDRVADIRRQSGCAIIKTISVSSAEDVSAANQYEGVADMLLYDAKAQADDALPGGNAYAFDWTLLADINPALPWFLAGGLNAGNLAEAVSASGARHVDVSSGVETVRGIKDPQKIAAFLSAAGGL